MKIELTAPMQKVITRDWTHHAASVRDLCIEAIEVRKLRRTYIAWLSQAIDEYFKFPS